MNFFPNKDAFFTFRKAFAAAQNDKRAHKTISEIEADIYDSSTGRYHKSMIKVKNSGWLSSAHFLLYNLVAGRDFYSGFSPKLRKTYAESGGDPNRGISEAVWVLDERIRDARRLLDKSLIKVPSWFSGDTQKTEAWVADEIKRSQDRINHFLEPFEGVFSVADLARVVTPMRHIACTDEELQAKKTYAAVLGPNIIDQTPTFTPNEKATPTQSPAKKSWVARALGV